MNMKLKILITTKSESEIKKGEIDLISPNLDEMSKKFFLPEIAFQIERAINETTTGLRAHISFEE